MLNADFLIKALELAKNSGSDVPVGAVIVRDGQIIAEGVNKREAQNRVIAHAEIVAIEIANKKSDNWRLDDCEIYVTLEPCPMCASAILQSRIKKIYFGAYDYVNGAFGSKSDMRKIMNIDAEVFGGIHEDKCSSLLKNYFERIRKC